MVHWILTRRLWWRYPIYDWLLWVSVCIFIQFLGRHYLYPFKCIIVSSVWSIASSILCGASFLGMNFFSPLISWKIFSSPIMADNFAGYSNLSCHLCFYFLHFKFFYTIITLSYASPCSHPNMTQFSFIAIPCTYIYLYSYIYIHEYNLLHLNNVTCMLVFRVNYLVLNN